MSGAIGIEQLKKLPEFISVRRKNAQLFQELFQNHPYLMIQDETAKSSWFGFSLVVRPGSPFSRYELVKTLQAAEIECRPIVTGNFLKNKEVLQYFDYEISGALETAEYIDAKGLFVGNHQVSLKTELLYLRTVTDQLIT